MKSEKTIASLETVLGHHFLHPELLEQALTHSSQARERESAGTMDGNKAADNEQLEFLGDSVLALVTSEELFHRFPHFHEGELSKSRAHLVSEKHLVQVAKKLDLGNYLRLGRGEEKSGGRNKTALLVDALEAVLGAIYLDGGILQARQFILEKVLLPELERLAQNGDNLPMTDHKSALQERLQAMGCPQPTYTLVKVDGPEHNKTFTMEAELRPPSGQGKIEFVAQAEGATKKSAEQDVARQILEYLAAIPEKPNGKPR